MHRLGLFSDVISFCVLSEIDFNDPGNLIIATWCVDLIIQPGEAYSPN